MLSFIELSKPYIDIELYGTDTNIAQDGNYLWETVRQTMKIECCSIRENPFFTSALQQYKFVIDTVRKGIDSPAFSDQTAFIQIFFELYPANSCAGYVFRI